MIQLLKLIILALLVDFILVAINLNINSFKIGLIAELLVIIFLKFCFYKIISWRFKTKHGEIDIIALKKDVIFFMEVKFRRNPISNDSILFKSQIKRIFKVSEFFLLKNPSFRLKKRKFIAVFFTPFPKIYSDFSFDFV